MRDEWFIRGEVPMTKAEVRAVSISKLELDPGAVLYDIGSGTGSVAVEASGFLADGMVYAIEKKPEAVKLIAANLERFGAKRIKIVQGEAPEAFLGLVRPTHAFIGGSSGAMGDIIDRLLEQNPRIRVVINIIALETLGAVMDVLKTRGIDAEIVSVQVSRAKKAGAFHLMQGQNPVYVISFGGEALYDR